MFYPVGNSQPSHWEINVSKNHFIKNEEITIQLHELYSKTDQSSSYQLTIPLLVSAQLGEVDLYKQIVSKIYSNLGLSPQTNPAEFQSIVAAWGKEATFNIWLMGRILVAADNIQDKATADQISLLMTNELEARTVVDPFTTWAWGYLAVHSYPDYCSKMIEATEALKLQAGEKAKDNVQWAMVMDILAAGSASDRDTYNHMIQELKDWTGKESIAEAILTIPKEDFPAWALAIVRVAAAKVGDVDTYHQLTKPIEQAIQDSPSEQDRLLAQVNAWSSSLIMG